MTDNEIKKMLECCKQEIDDNGVICGECKKCPNYEGKTGLCKEDLPTVVLDLINRLKAENERLKKETKHFADIGKLYSEIKTEAYKEFFKLVHSEFKTISDHQYSKLNITFCSNFQVAIDKLREVYRKLEGDK